MTQTLLEVENATVPFYHYCHDGIEYIEFDTSMCVPPEPMLNAMLALEKLVSSNIKVIMVNHRSPVGLLAKVGYFYTIETQELEDGKIKLTFSYKEGFTNDVDLSQKSCAGS